MFIASSAFLAILLDRPGALELVLEATAGPRKPITSPLVRYRVVVDLARRRAGHSAPSAEDLELASARFDELLDLLGCSEIMVTPKIARGAVALNGASGRRPDAAAEDLFEEACAMAAGARLLTGPARRDPPQGLAAR
ncbi:type II toxin-antitoxin system VapC family toxin [Cereibacter sphaeroides]|jgi:Uncharacterized protein conserved in bacteria|uniref:Uncharacterized protein n=2 Tax=Cereibacter sphaeroides TaxID=1063 RepID=Q3IV23_CERS4|nr:type II toxin-antitoxin system VapC family toxin [Cereibacter sphaeroides]ABA81611.1 hypothetical protein RSP_7383 [Cereibacter sphaeroides 2.4.1]AMJ49752.1 hypothetical protein APX01_19505 [Cereibacter sphaeroides]ANS36514.1 hypothetical protein A3858_19790 [Cereibacter sphaeroides]ATN65526.1 hypothetical protein A3857_19535 [Cereibacter sphaeroides]AXC64143.1 hypothetical protein DQL45_22460 [Cereibacter sphaeroides 2.4.1]